MIVGMTLAMLVRVAITCDEKAATASCPAIVGSSCCSVSCQACCDHNYVKHLLCKNIPKHLHARIRMYTCIHTHLIFQHQEVRVQNSQQVDCTYAHKPRKYAYLYVHAYAHTHIYIYIYIYISLTHSQCGCWHMLHPVSAFIPAWQLRPLNPQPSSTLGPQHPQTWEL